MHVLQGLHCGWYRKKSSKNQIFKRQFKCDTNIVHAELDPRCNTVNLKIPDEITKDQPLCALLYKTEVPITLFL